jgi:LmbE family N-acetylglucosaminyl deacetylase/GT2 family glycosyltransferase
VEAQFPPLLEPHALPTQVLCFAPHADDEVFGCGGMLAFHAGRGDRVRVVIISDGAAGDPSQAEGDIRAARQQESRAAGRALGVSDYRFLGFPDGRLGEAKELAARLAAEVGDFKPQLIYAPSPQEMHPDHRVLAEAVLGQLAAALPDHGVPGRQPAGGQAVAASPLLLLYGVNGQVQANVLFDTTRQYPQKRAAIDCFASQLRYHDLQGKSLAVDRARTVNIAERAVDTVEGFVALLPNDISAYQGAMQGLLAALRPARRGFELLVKGTSEDRTAWPKATAVISTWNKVKDVLANLEALEQQTHPFAEIVVVDNCSKDATVAEIRARHPQVRLVRMPDPSYGACETFNIGFACVTTPLLAILDDDVVLPPDWLEKATRRLLQEPESTAILSTKVVEPEMPESFKNSPQVNRERYMSTFRGCGSLAWTVKLWQAGFYDERLFIYGNERDLTCRLLNLGYRVLQYPGVTTYHSTPFGLQMGKRSLYFHARNAWLTQLKYAPLKDLLRLPWLVLTRVVLRSRKSEVAGEISDATGTIGIGQSLRKTPGAPWILIKAVGSILYNIPYCLRHRQPCRAADYQLPLK